MLVKKALTVGLSVMLSASLLIPVSALEPVKECQFNAQEKVKERMGSFNKYRTCSNTTYRNSYKQYKNTTYNNCYRPYTQEERLQKLGLFMEKIDKAYKDGWVKEERYNKLKEYLAERMKQLEDEINQTSESDTDVDTQTPATDEDTDTQTPEPDTDTDTQTSEPNTDTGTQTPIPDTGTDTPDQTEVHGVSVKEQQMIDLVNEARRENGLEPLIIDPDLIELAGMKSQDMIDNNYFSHNSPTYGSPFDMLKNNGVSYLSAGENIAGNYSVEEAHEALMNSTGHRKNILNPQYTHIGIGIQEGGKYGNMFTQLFIKK